MRIHHLPLPEANLTGAHPKLSHVDPSTHTHTYTHESPLISHSYALKIRKYTSISYCLEAEFYRCKTDKTKFPRKHSKCPSSKNKSTIFCKPNWKISKMKRKWEKNGIFAILIWSFKIIYTNFQQTELNMWFFFLNRLERNAHNAHTHTHTRSHHSIIYLKFKKTPWSWWIYSFISIVSLIQSVEWNIYTLPHTLAQPFALWTFLKIFSEITSETIFKKNNLA